MANIPGATDAQLQYIQSLCAKAELSSTDAAKRAGVAEPLSIDGASKVIDMLKQLLDPQPTGREGQGGDGVVSHTRSANALRNIHQGVLPTPDDLHEAEAWVLHRLAKLVHIEQAMGQPVRWDGANAGGPILVEHLLAFFGTVEAVATAFRVSVGTVRSGWAGVLPANRSHEAAWLTRGYVQPPA